MKLLCDQFVDTMSIAPFSYLAQSGIAMIHRTLSVSLLASLLVFVSCVPASAEGMPDRIRKTFEEHIIGAWEFTTVFDGQTTKQLVVNKWLPGKSAIFGINFDVEGKESSAAYSLEGWDEASKTIVGHGFGSSGGTWSVTYDKVGDKLWEGSGVGTWKGKEWRSPAKIEWTNNGFRYEDTTEGKPFIITGRRLSAGDPETALKNFADFMAGTWIRTDEGQERSHSYTWGLKKKFLRSNGRKDPLDPWDGMIGIDHGMGMVGWWGFFQDGGAGVVHLVDSSDDAWTFVGELNRPEGIFHRLVVIKKLAGDRLQSSVVDTKDGKADATVEDQIWEKKPE